MISIEWLRQFRVGEYALFDIVITYLGMLILSPLLSRFFRLFSVHVPKRSWLIWALPIGIIVHVLVGNYTLMTRYFLALDGHYVLKVCILGMVVLGFRGIRRVNERLNHSAKTF